MGLLSGLEELAKTPFDIVADVATLGGSINDKKEPYTVRRMKRVYQQLDR